MNNILSAGQQYMVKAVLSYTFNGQLQSSTTQNVAITVAPSPHLTVAYTLPRSIVDGKDAKIRVMVQNIGAGLARNLTIESLQPRIVENINHLPIGFTITVVGRFRVPADNPDIDR
jgi:hypothetical protein